MFKGPSLNRSTQYTFTYILLLKDDPSETQRGLDIVLGPF